MYETVEKLTTIDGYSISLHIFLPTKVSYQESNCNGVILAVHGLSEHIKRYQDLAEFTCSQNYVFACYNIRGHGSDDINRGDVQNFPLLILDIVFIFNTLKTLFQKINRERFALFGHSFGGLLITYAASLHMPDVKKIFLCAPGYSSKQKIPNWKIWLAKSLSLFLPKLQLPLDFDSNNLSNNPSTNEQYKNDSTILTHISARYGVIILNAMKEDTLQKILKNISAEVTILLPKDDKIVDSHITRKFLSSFQTTVTVYEIEGAGHECFNEKDEIKHLSYNYYEKWLSNL